MFLLAAPLQHFSRCSLALTVGAALSVAASAQESANQESANKKEDARVLQTLQVKAGEMADTPLVNMGTPAKTSKLNVSAHETPASIAVVGEEFIRDSGAKNIQDALLYSSGVYAGNYGFDTRGDWMSVRGLDVATYQDGLRSIFGYYNSTRTEVYALERIEVLKGPASVLYGQSELGGIVNAVSKTPKAERQGEIWGQVGSFDRTQVGVDSTGPLDDDGKWLYRVVALSRNSGAQVDHVSDDGYMVAPSLTWQPSDRTSVTLLLNKQESKGTVSAQFLPSRGTIDPAPRGRLDTSTFVGEPGWDRYDTDRSDISLFVNQALTENWKFALTARQTETHAETREHWPAIPGVPDDDGNIERTLYTVDRDTDVKSLDTRLEGNFALGISRHTLAVGIDYQDAFLNEGNLFSGFGGIINLYDPVYGNLQSVVGSDAPDTSVEQTGIYVIDHIDIGNVVLSGALRRDISKSTTLNPGAPDYVRKDKENSSHVGVMYKFANGISPYVSHTTAFLQNLGTNGGVGLKPTTGEQDEIGVKYLSPAQDLSVAFAWFDIEQENRVAQGDVPGGVRQTGSTVEGWELEVKKRWQRFELLANYTALDARDESIDERLAAVAEKMASVWGKYQMDNGVRLAVGARYTGDNVGYGGSPVIDSITLYDAMIGYAWGHWDFSLDGKNLGDKTYVSWCRYEGADCGYGERRTWNGNVRYRF